MILTDKCLKDFLQYAKNYCLEYEDSDRGVFLWFGNEKDFLHNDYQSFLYTIIIEFFDSVNFYIDTLMHNEKYFTIVKGKLLYEDYKTRQEAVENAIVHANKIYNKTQ